MNHIALTSVHNYSLNLSTGKRLEQAEKVLEVYKKGGDYTDREIEQITGIRSNTVSARRNELFDDKQIEFSQTRACKVTGRTVQSWRIIEQPSLFR